MQGMAAVTAASHLSGAENDSPKRVPGRLKQCVCGGVFGRGMSFEDRCKTAAELGVYGYDLVGPEQWPTVKKYGLIPSLATGTGMTIKVGAIHKEQHDKFEKATNELIDKAAAAGVPDIILLAGERGGMSDEQGWDNAVAITNKFKGHAEDKGINLVMELLNSKVDHPDYICDRTSWGVEYCKRVNSPRVKLLFDIYHMQIMEGDIIRTVRKNMQYIGHFHTAGNPGRHEMDDTQEMHYKGIAKAIADLGYQGYIAHEYSPQRDAVTSLKETLKLFEV